MARDGNFAIRVRYCRLYSCLRHYCQKAAKQSSNRRKSRHYAVADSLCYAPTDLDAINSASETANSTKPIQSKYKNLGRLFALSCLYSYKSLYLRFSGARNITPIAIRKPKAIVSYAPSEPQNSSPAIARNTIPSMKNASHHFCSRKTVTFSASLSTENAPTAHAISTARAIAIADEIK